MDPHSIDGCPVGHRCESCGTDRQPLRVHAIKAGPGAHSSILCLTLCQHCRRGIPADGHLTFIQPSTIQKLITQHTAHVRGQK